MRPVLGTMTVTALLAGGFLLFRPVVIVIKEDPAALQVSRAAGAGTEAPAQSAFARPAPLADPPAVVYAKYLSAWSAGSEKKIKEIVDGARTQGINAVVLDIKDYSGYVSYRMDVAAARSAGADKDLRITDIDKVVDQFHASGIYVIARITVFQDPIFAKAHPELALKDKTTGGLWKDRKGLAWLDPAGKATWDYAADIAKDAFAHGVDEANFDYVRFPSDGNLKNADYPFWDQKTPRHEILRDFFAYLRQSLAGRRISADLFGLAAVDQGDMGIGQVIEDAYPYFDAVAPMVYPSHFASGVLGYKNPADHPYEVMTYALSHALSRWDAQNSSTTMILGRIRPWIQVFDLGAAYTPEMVRSELKAAEDSLASSTAYGGWMLWDPANRYRSFDALY